MNIVKNYLYNLHKIDFSQIKHWNMWSFSYNDPKYESSFFGTMIDPLINDGHKVYIVTNNLGKIDLGTNEELSKATLITLNNFLASNDDYDGCIIVTDTSVTDLIWEETSKVWRTATYVLKKKLKNNKCLMIVLGYVGEKLKVNDIGSIEKAIREFDARIDTLILRMCDHHYWIISHQDVSYVKVNKGKKNNKCEYIVLGRDISVNGKIKFLNDNNSIDLCIESLE